MRSFERYCNSINDISKVENYEVAKKDNFKGWHCHHRLETHNSDGERRLAVISRAELIALDMYWDRPPEELIFLTQTEHRRLHNTCSKGKHHSEKWRKKVSEAKKGKPKSEEHRKKLSEAAKGKHPSEETRRKMSEAQKGKRLSEETKSKISEARKGKR